MTFVAIDPSKEDLALWRAIGQKVGQQDIVDHKNAVFEIGFVYAMLSRKYNDAWDLSVPRIPPVYWWSRKITRKVLEYREVQLQNLIAHVFAKVQAARKAAAAYELTEIPIAVGRSYHRLTVTEDGIFGHGHTCCDDRRYGCAYLGQCMAKAPKSGLVSRFDKSRKVSECGTCT